jgi:hypothetical protein
MNNFRPIFFHGGLGLNKVEQAAQAFFAVLLCLLGMKKRDIEPRQGAAMEGRVGETRRPASLAKISPSGGPLSLFTMGGNEYILLKIPLEAYSRSEAVWSGAQARPDGRHASTPEVGGSPRAVENAEQHPLSQPLK